MRSPKQSEIDKDVRDLIKVTPTPKSRGGASISIFRSTRTPRGLPGREGLLLFALAHKMWIEAYARIFDEDATIYVANIH